MGGKTTSTSATKLNQVSIQSSALGLPLAIGWGRGRITRPNLIWYGGFRATSHTTKTSGGKGLGGGSSNTTYSYTASIILALCEGGPSGIRGVVTTYRDSSVLAGVGAAGLSLAAGAPGQSTWGYLTSMFPSQALGYSGISYVYAQDYALSDSATLPNHSFEVDFALQLGGGVVDADPSAVITDFLISAQYGVPGWSAGLIDPTTFADYSLYARASGLLLSPVLESQSTAASIMTEWLLATNSFAVWSEGVLKIRPYGDAAVTGNGVTWTPNLAPEYDLTEDDMIADGDGCPVQQTINDQSDAYNIVQLEYLDRANQYNTAIATAQDLANIVEFGSRKQDPTTVHSICDAGVAQISAQLYLQRTLYVREGYATKVPWNFVLLEPGDLITLTTVTDELQLARELVRIVGIDEDEDGVLSLTCEGLDIGTASAALYASHSAQGYQANTNIAPGSVSPPSLFEAPAALTGFDPEVWIAVASTSPTWGGCNVWISADNTHYRQVGVINEAARYGVTTADLPAHADPDNDDTLAVDLSTSLGVITGGTAAEMNAGATLALIDGEVIGYQNATLTAANRYNLAPLRRGMSGTAIVDHPVGDPFIRLDDAVFKFGFKELDVGDTLYLKFTSFNLWGNATEDLANVATYTMAVSAAAARYSWSDLPDPDGTKPQDGATRNVPKGAWNASYTYQQGDIVTYQGSSYIAGEAVPAGTPPTNTIYWDQLAQMGPAGPQGTQGTGGAPGATGPAGQTLYTWVAYADSIDGTINFTTGAPSGRGYQGLAVNQASAAKGTNPAAYVWSAYKGPPSFGLVAGAGVTISSNRIIKTTGQRQWGDAGAYSSEGWTNGAQLSVQCPIIVSTYGEWMTGLNTDPTTDNSYTSIDYAWYCQASGSHAQIYESGAYIMDAGSMTAGDTLSIQYDGATIRYYKNGSVVRSTPAASGLTFYFDCALNSPTAAIDVIGFSAAGRLGDTGATGPAGIPGANGMNVHLAYASSSDGSQGFQAGGANPGLPFIGVYTDTNPTGSTDYHAYNWTRFTGLNGPTGPQGVAGAVGPNGQQSYVHFAYADSADGSQNFAVGQPGTRAYIGVYSDYTTASSGSYQAYSWSLIKGANGPTGATGPAGANGVDGLAALNIRTVGAVRWDGHNLSCTSSAGNWTTNGAYSGNVIPGGVALAFQRPNYYPTEDAFVGITSAPTASIDYSKVTFAWRMRQSGSSYFAETWYNANPRGSFTWDGGSIYTIRYDDKTGYVTWYQTAGGTTTVLDSYNIGTGLSFGFEASAGQNMSVTNVAFTAAGGTGAIGPAGPVGPAGNNGVSPSPKYTAFSVSGEGTWACSYPIPLTNGQTLTVNTSFSNTFSSTKSSPATITSQIQYSLDGGTTWNAMSGGSVSQQVYPSGSGGSLTQFQASGTYTASGAQTVNVQVVVTRTGNSDAQFGYNHGYGQPS